MGCQVVPALTVFQTPPLAAETYQVPRSVGSTAISEIRPLISAGPNSRNRKLDSRPELIPGAGSLGWSESCPQTAFGSADKATAKVNESVQIFNGLPRFKKHWKIIAIDRLQHIQAPSLLQQLVRHSTALFTMNPRGILFLLSE